MFLELFLCVLPAYLLIDALDPTYPPDDPAPNPERQASPRRSFRLGIIAALVTWALTGAWLMGLLALVVLLIVAGVHFGFARVYRPGVPWFAGLHVVSVGLLAVSVYAMCAAVRSEQLMPSFAWVSLFGPRYFQFLAVVAGGLAAFNFCAEFAAHLLEPLRKERDRIRREGRTAPENGQAAFPPPPPREPEPKGLEGSSVILGQAERLLILMAVLMDAAVLVGFLITAKSLYRFGELTDREHRADAEYIAVGTLVSFTVGVAVALLTRLAVGALEPAA